MESDFVFSTIRSVFIQQCYFHLLGRVADTEGFQSWNQSNLTMAEIHDGFINCDERKAIINLRDDVKMRLEADERTQHILLFGAFGNGNLGDAAMPDLIARDLQSRHDVSLYSYSELDHADYEFPAEKKLQKAGGGYGPLNPLILSLFDGLWIGGGGLLAFPHLPLWDSEWPYLLSIPYAIIACGAAESLPSQLHNLVRLARCASARDASSLRAMASINPNATICPDPILALAKAPNNLGEGVGRAFILRGPVRDAHHDIRASLRPDDVIICVELASDYPLFSLFPNMRIVTTLNELFLTIENKNSIISERFHGVVCALHAGKRTFGLTRGDHNESKIHEIFVSFGGDLFCSNNFDFVDTNFPYAMVQQMISDAQYAYKKATDKTIGDMFDSDSTHPGALYGAPKDSSANGSSNLCYLPRRRS